MEGKEISTAAYVFLRNNGADGLDARRLEDLPALVQVFLDHRPDMGPDSLSQEALAYLTAVADCISQMDERLYEQRRKMIDLFRGTVLALPAEKLLENTAWRDLCLTGVRMGLLPEEKYGASLSRPHIGVPEVYLREREVVRS